MASYVQIVNRNGNCNYNDCNWNDNGVRPFLVGRRKKVSVRLKLESRFKKNEHPFLCRNAKDKHKGIKILWKDLKQTLKRL